VIAVATPKIEIIIEINIIELFCANKRELKIREIKLAKSPRIKALTSLLEFLIKDKNDIDKEIKTRITTLKAPRIPTVDNNSNNEPEALSKRIFQRGEALKFPLLNLEKL